MNKALKKGAIEVSKNIIRQNRLFDVPKKDTEERRVILDLKKLNLFIGCETFKMTTVAQVRKILPKGGWAVSIDLKDAYWHVPVAQKFRKFLGFKLGEESYRFKVMPFGLNIAPRMFTKLVNVVIKCLRQKNVLVVNYLDDWLVWGQTKVECEKAMKETLLEIEKRGFIVNVEKSNLIPSQDFQWLGIQWNLKEATLTIPNQTRRKASNAVRTFLKKKKVTRRFLEKLMGLLQFCSITDPWLKVRLKDINKFWLKSACNRLRDKSQMLRHKQKVALSPWNKMKAFRRKTKLHPGPVTHIVHTDASKWGWGGHSDVQTTFGKWSAVMSKCHINFLELRAADLV
ncbi:MAG: reverse transcriptase domain-containing protein, partial [Cyanobacteria bacterium J06582_2]